MWRCSCYLWLVWATSPGVKGPPRDLLVNAAQNSDPPTRAGRRLFTPAFKSLSGVGEGGGLGPEHMKLGSAYFAILLGILGLHSG